MQNPIRWYFAIKKENLEQVRKLNLAVQFEDDANFPSYIKIYPLSQSGRDKYNVVLSIEDAGVPTYEGDLMNDRRWYIDTGIEVAENYRKLYFDIETDDSVEKIEIGRDRILSWAGVDSDGKVYFEKISAHSDEAEKKLLIKFLKILPQYDLILGWNSKGFDVPYLKARMRRYDLHKTKDYCWKDVGHFDLLARFRHIFRFDSNLRTFSLEFISQHFLGRGKVERSEKVIDLWKNNQEKLQEYNIEDCNLVKALDEKLGVSAMMIRQSQWCGVPASQFGLYSIIDAHIMRMAHKHGEFCRTSVDAIRERDMKNTRGNENPESTNTEKAKYSGAIVLDPITGKYTGVHTFDFKGLYPSMMRTSNIGYDTLRYEAAGSETIINPGTLSTTRKDGSIRPTYFLKSPSVINRAISELITKRSEYKKLKLQMIEDGVNKGPVWEKVVSDEIIVKELANSTYGIMGLEYGRYFSIDVAESITLFGQWCILFAKRFFEERGLPVIYGDTDSVFVVTGDREFDIDAHLDAFHAELQKELKEKYNIDECYIQLEFDKKYESLLLIEKKTYVGHVTNIERKKTNEVYARGLEFAKKNTFSYAAKKQKELVDFLLYQTPTKHELQDYLTAIRDEFYKTEFSREELAITQKVNKDLSSYKKTPPLHVRLAMAQNEKTGQFFRNMEIEYIITHQGKTTEGVLIQDYTGQFDRDYYWENKTQPVLERVANAVYPGNDWFCPNLTLF